MSSNCTLPFQEADQHKMKLFSPQENKKDMENIKVLRQIAKARFPIYLAKISSTGEKLALKLFSYKKDQPNLYYLNESRFEPLNHPNVIQMVGSQDETLISFTKTTKKYSCILMEYCPYGDFFNFMGKYRKDLNEKLIRTYFKQLIEGLEYLHSVGVYHLDLKLENLLIGADFQLKIADFDLAYFTQDSKIISSGTEFFRAPELRSGWCRNPAAADVYAAGVLLFVLKCGGVIPHAEDNLCEGVHLFELLESNPEEFFSQHMEIQGRDLNFFDDDFKELFTGMMRQDPKDRITLEDVMKSKWYNEPVYSKQELRGKMKEILNLAQFHED